MENNNDKFLDQANQIIENTFNNEYYLTEEANKIVSDIENQYILDLQERWKNAEDDLIFALTELKPIKKRFDELGILPDSLKEDTTENKKVLKLLDEAFKLMPEIILIEPEIIGHIKEDDDNKGLTH